MTFLVEWGFNLILEDIFFSEGRTEKNVLLIRLHFSRYDHFQNVLGRVVAYSIHSIFSIYYKQKTALRNTRDSGNGALIHR